MSKKMGKNLKALSSMAMAVCMGTSLCGGALSVTADTGAAANKYYNDYNSMDEALDAAAKLNLELSEEGNVLLKNDGTLPLNGNERISVFGVRSDALVGGAGNNSVFGGAETEAENSDGIADALLRAGFNVNPTLMNFYAADGSSVGAENLAFTGESRNSMEMYDDAAVIVFSREGGEGSDSDTVTSELVKAEDDHLALKKCQDADYDEKYEGNAEYFDAEGNHYHKHFQMLTDSEEELVNYVTERFDKVIIVLNTSNVMEMAELQADPSINAIIDMERPGQNGVDAVAEILNGSVNPSGHLVDEWMSDVTTDPTWYNFSYNEQGNSSNMYVKADGTAAMTVDGSTGDKNSYFGVDYEEGIYLGYKYYETYYQDIYNGTQPIPAAYEGMSKEEAAQQWWLDNVTYPFGYGLSYTKFSMNLAGGLYTDEALTTELGAEVSADQFSSEVGGEQAIKTLYVPVTVTNTGDVAGKEVAQVYVSAPYTSGGIEKAANTLVGYAKTDLLQPGESQTVVVSFNVQDMASWDYNDANADGVKGDYEMDGGTYVIRVMENSHYDCATDAANTEDAYAETSFNLSGTAHQHVDDFSGNELSNKFSEENGVYSADAEGNTMYYNSIRTSDLMEDEQYAETILSRADMAGTFPQAPVYITEKDAEGNITSVAGDLVFKQGAVDNWNYYDSFNLSQGDKDQETDNWYIDEETLAGLMSNWTQDQDNGIRFTDIAGVSLEDTETWTAFMNQLSWEELTSLVENGGYSTTAVESVGKAKAVDADGPNNFNNTYVWCDATTISSTWNTDLAEKEGRLMGCIGMFSGATGWYGPGMNTHRSPFSGRNNEYYSQDGIHGGYIAAAVVKGAESKGLICYIKHLAFNEQETCRDGKVLFSWIDEQTMRENIAKVFQMAIQEGGSSAAMTGYARIGGIPNTSNHNLISGLLQGEWGFDGYMVTDGYIGWREATELDMMVRAGNSMQLYTSPFVEELSGEWDAEANSVRITTEDGESYISNLQYYYTRLSAQSILYKTANSTNNMNGFGDTEYAGTEFTLDQFISADGVSAAIAPEVLADSTAVYSVKSGKLPEGLTLDAATGEITGAAKEYGTFTAVIQATIDTYVNKEAEFTFTVNPAFYIDEDWDALDAAQVGVAFESKIESDVFTTADGKFDTVVYSVAEGTLPAGMTVSEDGTISGTPEEMGVYDVTVKAVATKTVETTNFFGMAMEETTTIEGTYSIRIIVADENGVMPEIPVEEVPEEVPADLPEEAGDAPMGDAPAGDAPMGDAPMGDAPMGDAPAGDAPMGDAPMGDAPQM